MQTRGGRTIQDVFYIATKPFIFMRRSLPTNKQKRIDIPIRLPDDCEINMEYQKTKHGNYRICQFKKKLHLKNKHL